MSDLMSQMIKDAAGLTATDEEIRTISDLAAKQLELADKIIQFENLVETTKEELRQVSEFLLPNAMAAAGVSELKLSNGKKITIADDVYASIRKDHLERAIAWLDDNGLGGIVKDDVSVKFGRGESAQRLLEFCAAQGLNAEEKLSVHPQTLKATVKEQLSRGVQFPDDLFSVHPVRKAKIK